MKKTIIIAISVIGVFLIGWLFGEIKSTATWSSLLSFQQEVELEREAGKAFQAYRKENNEIGIYSLREFLGEIDHRQEMVGVEENQSAFTFYRIQTHCRLAKLYADAGNMDESEIHRGKALDLAESDESFKTLFTEMSFEALVEYFDSKEPSNENKSE